MDGSLRYRFFCDWYLETQVEGAKETARQLARPIQLNLPGLKGWSARNEFYLLESSEESVVLIPRPAPPSVATKVQRTSYPANSWTIPQLKRHSIAWTVMVVNS
ncbi:hypothetical protein Poly21_19130 [Allorhodopirellula heiligendammensis]|uniref:Uncharacterized protein n=1 Tax=Allorhodopirellula heiligendammensis TaxID=2714739 RepID=A0A5C6C6K2_9BACT|nr:hypothetical protein Poly21_19130 [Allorhodopirellula heiligendammensis]